MQIASQVASLSTSELTCCFFFRCLGYLIMIMTLYDSIYDYYIYIWCFVGVFDCKKTLLTRYIFGSLSRLSRGNFIRKRIPTDPQEKDSLVAWNVGFGVCLGGQRKLGVFLRHLGQSYSEPKPNILSPVGWIWWLGPNDLFTPLKINMEPKNHPIEKECHLSNLHFGFHVNFQGCRWFTLPETNTSHLPGSRAPKGN